MKYINILHNQIKQVVGQLVSKLKLSSEQNHNMTQNEIMSQKQTLLKNAQILYNQVNQFDPNGVNDLFEAPAPGSIKLKYNMNINSNPNSNNSSLSNLRESAVSIQKFSTATISPKVMKQKLKLKMQQSDTFS